MGVKILVGNSLEVLPTLEPNSVYCSVSSPPYFSLRKYEGDQECEWPGVEYLPMSGLPPITVEAMTCALGHESTIEAYVGHLVAIYREVWRVLRDDGVTWVVMGDSYAGSGIHAAHHANPGLSKAVKRGADLYISAKRVGLKQGDLMLVPHRLALALQADGWVVRNDVIWAKKAPMPESVSGFRWERHRVKVKKSDRATNLYQSGAGTKQGAGVASRAQREAYYEQGEGATEYIDCPGCPKCEPNGGYVLKRGSWRHTRAHEFVFMLTKRMQYWSDQEVVRESITTNPQRRLTKEANSDVGTERADRKPSMSYKYNGIIPGNPAGRNPRSVLSPSPEPFSGSHFAVFPTSLVEPLIKATCPDKCCPECGAGWSPLIERRKADMTKPRPFSKPGCEADRNDVGRIYEEMNSNILGYRPTCGCGHDDHVPGVCLDLFFGAGTTGLICDRLGLDCIGIEISEGYAAMAKKRIEDDAPLLARVEVEGS